MLLVIHSDVFVAALSSDRGASRQILALALERRITILGSVPLILEYEAVATAADHLAESGLTAPEINEVMDALISVVVPVNPHFLWRPQLKDAHDEMVLATAVTESATHVVTFKVRQMQNKAAKFGIHAAQPRDILHTIRSGIREGSLP